MAPTRRSAKPGTTSSKSSAKAGKQSRTTRAHLGGQPATAGKRGRGGAARQPASGAAARATVRASPRRSRLNPRAAASEATGSRAHPTSGARTKPRGSGLRAPSVGGNARRGRSAPARPVNPEATTATRAPARGVGLTSDERRIRRRQHLHGGAGSRASTQAHEHKHDDGHADTNTGTNTGTAGQPPRAARARTTDAVSKHAMREAARTHKTDHEPSDEDLSGEQSRIDEELENASKTRQTPAPGKDLLASYMEQLSHIPLFTPQQEIDNARYLETLELHTLVLVLNAPKAVEHLSEETGELEPALRGRIDELLQGYRRAATRAPGRNLPGSSKRDKLKEELAAALRFADFDKEMLDRVMGRLRRETWSRRVLGPSQAFRLSHAAVCEIERSRAAAVRTRNEFVRANLRLVVSVARNFHHYRIPFIDLIQEGNVGLMKAVHRFDHRRGFRFSTYAHWWIRQSIERAIINKGSQVRLPVHVIDSRRQVGRAAAQLTQSLGRSPTSSEIARRVKMPVNKVEQILGGVQQDPVSLDENVGSDDPRKFVDLVRDDNTPGVDEMLIRENTHDRIRELLHLLNPIEKDIIRRRFGLGDDTDQTLDEIGKIYNLSRERVRQIQAQGLMKMRRMCDRRKIS